MASKKEEVKEKRQVNRDTVVSALDILGRFRRRISRLGHFGILPQEVSVRVMGHILDIEKDLGNGK